MLPAISIGELTISLYWTMFYVGVIAMGVLVVKRRKLYHISLPGAIIITILITIFGVVGAKLLGALQNLESVRSNGMSSAGFSFFGAVYMVPLGLMLFATLLGTTKQQMLDTIAPCMAAIVAFMRVGCFLNGCCGGLETTVAGFTFHWPTQIIESFGDFAVLGMILHWEEKHKFEGKLYAIFLGGYGILRFIVEFMRDTDKRLLGLGDGQWLALLAILICMIALKGTKQKKMRKVW